jgi:hypothetical protein
MEHVPFDHVGRNIGMLTPDEQRQLQEATVAGGRAPLRRRGPVCPGVRDCECGHGGGCGRASGARRDPGLTTREERGVT